MNYKDGGLEPRYVVQKRDGGKVDNTALYFVLRLDTDPHARKAAVAYAKSVYKENPVLSRDLMQTLKRLDQREPLSFRETKHKGVGRF